LDRLNLLQRITRAIGERQDLGSIFQVIIRSLEESLPIDFGCVCCTTRWPEPYGHERRCQEPGAAMELALTEKAPIGTDENGMSRCMHGQLVYEPDIDQVKLPFPQRLAAADCVHLSQPRCWWKTRSLGF